MPERPGPTALLRGRSDVVLNAEKIDSVLQEAADLVVRYGKKVKGEDAGANVKVEKMENDPNPAIDVLSHGIVTGTGE